MGTGLACLNRQDTKQKVLQAVDAEHGPFSFLLLRYHFSAMSAAGTYDDIMVVLQTSTDCGHTFSDPQISKKSEAKIESAHRRF